MMMYIYGLYEIWIAFDLGTFIITIEIYSRDDSYENGARKPCIYNESKWEVFFFWSYICTRRF